MYVTGFLLIIILSNCIRIDWSRKLQPSPYLYCPSKNVFTHMISREVLNKIMKISWVLVKCVWCVCV